jgi:outer membrane protein OmpA-like peptidoglycan-associated protein
MKIASVTLAAIGILCILPAPADGQLYQSVGAPKQQGQSTPLYRVTMVARSTKAINYGHLKGGTRIDFRGTVLAPMARGQAKVESRRGAVRIQAQFDRLQAASQYGPEYLTYVLWAISPAGRADNLGEVLLQGTKSKIEATAELQAFALVVTAEPYFAVIQPSDVVVMENVVRPDTVGSVEEVDAKFDLLQRGQYSSVSANLEPMRMDPKTPLGLYEARNAVLIARVAGADHYVPDNFQKAEQLLRQAETYQAQKGDRKRVEMSAREAVQTAEDARAITVKRREDERLAQERQAAAEREARAKAEAEEASRQKVEAERAKLEAQLAAERAARERAEAESARAALLVQQQVLQTEAQQARQSADFESRQRAAAEAGRAAALTQQQIAQSEAERARRAAEESDRLRQQAESEKTELRARLLKQLNLILQTRDSARGLIVNMSDVLFDSGRYTLRPAAREKLAKISGIVVAHPGLNLQVEGHTDSVGSDEYNQQLSERRSAIVRDFLVQQGVSSSSISARGFGKSIPVSSNDSAEGRAQNRRVELVVTGEAIGTTTVAGTAAQ